jgi:hypothetical protein
VKHHNIMHKFHVLKFVKRFSYYKQTSEQSEIWVSRNITYSLQVTVHVYDNWRSDRKSIKVRRNDMYIFMFTNELLILFLSAARGCIALSV